MSKVNRAKHTNESNWTHPSNNLLDLLLVTLHLEHIAHLHEIDLLPVSHADNLVKRAQQLERILQNLPLLCAPAKVRDDAREKMEGLDVLEDVGCLVGDEQDVEVL